MSATRLATCALFTTLCTLAACADAEAADDYGDTYSTSRTVYKGHSYAGKIGSSTCTGAGRTVGGTSATKGHWVKCT